MKKREGPDKSGTDKQSKKTQKKHTLNIFLKHYTETTGVVRTKHPSDNLEN